MINKWIKLWKYRYNDSQHRYYKCNNCGQIARIPKGKNKVIVICPRCSLRYETKYYLSKTMLIIVLAAIIGIGGGLQGAYFYINRTPISSIKASNNEAVIEDSNGEKVAKKINPSVVSITTETQSTQNYGYGNQVVSGAGSGVIYTSNGYIITCNHVIDGASQITVTTSDNKNYSAKVMNTYPNNDIAIIKIDAENLTPTIFADSSKIKYGDKVYAMGNPEGKFSNSITSGIISSTSRSITVSDDESNSRYNNNSYTLDVIQTDVAVSPGNSGGGLFDTNGNLIGIVSAKTSNDSSEGLAFAIHSNKVLSIIKNKKG